MSNHDKPEEISSAEQDKPEQNGAAEINYTQILQSLGNITALTGRISQKNATSSAKSINNENLLDAFHEDLDKMLENYGHGRGLTSDIGSHSIAAYKRFIDLFEEFCKKNLFYEEGERFDFNILTNRAVLAMNQAMIEVYGKSGLFRNNAELEGFLKSNQKKARPLEYNEKDKDVERAIKNILRTTCLILSRFNYYIEMELNDKKRNDQEQKALSEKELDKWRNKFIAEYLEEKATGPTGPVSQK